MNINSEYIQKKEFHTAFKGYSMEEVDKFLDILAVEFDRLIKKNKELQDSLDKMKFENPSQDEDVSKLVSDVLVSAHKIADEIKGKAEKEAKDMIKQKKDTEEMEIKNLTERKKIIDEQLQQTQEFYKNFLAEIKSSMKGLSLKVEDIEKNFKQKSAKISVSEDNYSPVNDSDIKTENPLSENIDESENEEDSYKNDEAGIPPSEEQDKIIELEEDKKIRDFIESGSMEGESRDMPERKFDEFQGEKTEKKIFDEYEEGRIYKNRRKTDIGNPDIIDEFFGG
ncbi:MAG TPA: DivIVA domain-containing protein [Actinobacteria bacterium]|jgi:cell division initiation protein|nr:DivIVA domain-containing protein [Actinomycetota bacterium]